MRELLGAQKNGDAKRRTHSDTAPEVTPAKNRSAANPETRNLPEATERTEDRDRDFSASIGKHQTMELVDGKAAGFRSATMGHIVFCVNASNCFTDSTAWLRIRTGRKTLQRQSHGGAGGGRHYASVPDRLRIGSGVAPGAPSGRLGDPILTKAFSNRR